MKSRALMGWKEVVYSSRVESKTAIISYLKEKSS